MEPPWPVDQVIIQPVQAVAGNDKEFFAIRSAIKQAEQPGLRVGLILTSADVAEGLVKFIKQENSLLVDGLNVCGNAGNELVDNNDRIPIGNRPCAQAAGKQRFSNSLIAT